MLISTNHESYHQAHFSQNTGKVIFFFFIILRSPHHDHRLMFTHVSLHPNPQMHSIYNMKQEKQQGVAFQRLERASVLG